MHCRADGRRLLLDVMTLEGWRNLWFHSGDLACLDEDGDPVFVARTSERIRVKGEMG